MNKSLAILIFGAAGSGTTTLGRELARKLDLFHIDIDDYSWEDTKLTYAKRLPHAKRIVPLETAIENCDTRFVMTGSICGWGDIFIPLFDAAIFMTTPTDMRMERLQKREYQIFGERICEGGDMHESHTAFIRYASTYDTGKPPDRCLELHEKWIEVLPCPVFRIDGSLDYGSQVDNLIKKLLTRVSI